MWPHTPCPLSSPPLPNGCISAKQAVSLSVLAHTGLSEAPPGTEQGSFTLWPCWLGLKDFLGLVLSGQDLKSGWEPLALGM